MIALVRVEMRRALARRAVRVVLVIALLGVAIGAVVVFLNSRADVDPALLRAEAHAMRSEHVRGCAGDVDLPPGVDEIAVCDRQIPPVEEFIQDPRFHLARLGEALGFFAMLFTMLGLGLGASMIGAEWHHRTMTTTLTWEPRRTRVLAAKLVSFALVVFLGALAVQMVLVLALLPSALFRGTTEGVDLGWAASLAATMLRISAAAVIGATVGQAVAMITRNTAAALGSMFLYLAVLERMLAGFRPRFAPWLLAENLGVFVTGDRAIAPGRTPVESGLLLAAYLGILFVLARAAFRRHEVA